MGKLNAVLVGLITPAQNEERTKEYLDELAFLADTNNTNCVKRFVQRLDSPNTSTYVGEGKLQEINQYVQQFADTLQSEVLALNRNNNTGSSREGIHRYQSE